MDEKAYKERGPIVDGNNDEQQQSTGCIGSRRDFSNETSTRGGENPRPSLSNSQVGAGDAEISDEEPAAVEKTLPVREKNTKTSSEYIKSCWTRLCCSITVPYNKMDKLTRIYADQTDNVDSSVGKRKGKEKAKAPGTPRILWVAENDRRLPLIMAVALEKCKGARNLKTIAESFREADRESNHESALNTQEGGEQYIGTDNWHGKRSRHPGEDDPGRQPRAPKIHCDDELIAMHERIYAKQKAREAAKRYSALQKQAAESLIEMSRSANGSGRSATGASASTSGGKTELEKKITADLKGIRKQLIGELTGTGVPGGYQCGGNGDAPG